MWFTRKLQKILIYYGFGFVFSKLPWLGKNNMATTLRTFWGPTLLMLLNMHGDS